MATVTIVGSNVTSTGVSSTTSLSCGSLPAGILNSDLLLIDSSINGSSITPTQSQSGTSGLTGSPLTYSTAFREFGYSKSLASSDSSAAMSQTVSSARLMAMGWTVLRGTFDNVANYVGSVQSTSITIPAITPVANDCLLVALVASNSIAGTTTYTAPSGWTLQGQACTNGGTSSDQGVVIFTKQLTGQAGVSQTASTSGVSSPTAKQVSFVVSVAPAAAPPPSASSNFFFMF